MTWKSFFLGLLFIICGVAIIYFYRQLYQMFGSIAWAEKYVGDSRAIYPLFGAGLIVLGIVVMFGAGGGAPTELVADFGTNE